MSTNDNQGYLYLLQPRVLIGVHNDSGDERFKIGRGQTIDRPLHGYRKGTEIICVIKVNDYRNFESILKKEFNKKFKCVAGCEFFEGDRSEIIRTFLQCILDNEDYESDIEYGSESDIEYESDIESEPETEPDFFEDLVNDNIDIPAKSFIPPFLYKKSRICNGIRANTLYNIYVDYCATHNICLLRKRMFFNSAGKFISKIRTRCRVERNVIVVYTIKYS